MNYDFDIFPRCDIINIMVVLWTYHHEQISPYYYVNDVALAKNDDIYVKLPRDVCVDDLKISFTGMLPSGIRKVINGADVNDYFTIKFCKWNPVNYDARKETLSRDMPFRECTMWVAAKNKFSCGDWTLSIE